MAVVEEKTLRMGAAAVVKLEEGVFSASVGDWEERLGVAGAVMRQE